VNQTSADVEFKEPESPYNQYHESYDQHGSPLQVLGLGPARRERREWQITDREKRLAEIEAVGCHWRLVHD
jgi:hypothetical protein